MISDWVAKYTQFIGCIDNDNDNEKCFYLT